MKTVAEKRPFTTPDGELREDLTDEELASFRPAHEVLPPQLLAGLRRIGRPPGSNKVSTTVRFDRDIVEAFRAGGAGWQTRMNDALREWLDTHPQAARG
ncbi:MAG: BrnA antitoxin family protein [Pseudomonadota bacterium]|nr:BrnA antitoxin family protein [Pseudomonadota bacterium]